jgi:phosphoserine phosphatase
LNRFLVVCDVDSTLIENEAIDLLAQLAGSGKRVSEITARAMAGELDFAASLRERVATLTGLSVTALDEVRSLLKLTTGAVEFATAVHSNRGRICAVSGGFRELLGEIEIALKLDAVRANSLEVESERLTGRLVGEVVGPIQKRQALEGWIGKFEIDPDRVIAVGDGANDLEMMRAATLSVAFDAKAVVRDRATISLPSRDLSLLVPLLPMRR